MYIEGGGRQVSRARRHQDAASQPLGVWSTPTPEMFFLASAWVASATRAQGSIVVPGQSLGAVAATPVRPWNQSPCGLDLPDPAVVVEAHAGAQGPGPPAFPTAPRGVCLLAAMSAQSQRSRQTAGGQRALHGWALAVTLLGVTRAEVQALLEVISSPSACLCMEPG